MPLSEIHHGIKLSNSKTLQIYSIKEGKDQFTNHVYFFLIHSTSSKCPSSSHFGQHSPLVFSRVITEQLHCNQTNCYYALEVCSHIMRYINRRSTTTTTTTTSVY